MRDQFSLSEELLKIHEDDAANYYIPNETEIAGKSDQDLARYLNGNKQQQQQQGTIVDEIC